MQKIQSTQIYLFAEFVLLFFGVPVLLLLEGELIHPSTVLIPIVAFVFIILHFWTDFRWKELWDFPEKWSTVLIHMGIAILVSLVMMGWVYFFDRQNLFNLPFGNWRLWLMLSTFYPVFSASIQEVIFRTFIFRRYERLFNGKQAIIFASAIAFSFAHIFYFHIISLLLTFILGLYLGWIYYRMRSVLFTALLHSIYGNMVFTVGMGHYFWLDMFNWI